MKYTHLLLWTMLITSVCHVSAFAANRNADENNSSSRPVGDSPRSHPPLSVVIPAPENNSSSRPVGDSPRSHPPLSVVIPAPPSLVRMRLNFAGGAPAAQEAPQGGILGSVPSVPSPRAEGEG